MFSWRISFLVFNVILMLYFLFVLFINSKLLIFQYFEQDDPDLYLSKIKYVVDTDLEATDSLELYFSEDQYDSQTGQLLRTVELVPNGCQVRVTNSNKLRYLDALAQHKLANSVRDEVDAFLKGLNDLIPDNLLSIFDENELEVKLILFQKSLLYCNHTNLIIIHLL